MATLYSDLFPEVLPECKGLPEPTAIVAIRNATRYFCENSTAWRYELPLITTVTGESSTGEYTLAPPANTQIISVLAPIQHNDLNVPNKTRQWLDYNVIEWRAKTGIQANYYFMVSNTILRLVPYPLLAQTNSLRISISLKPTKTSTNFDDYIYSEYGEAIAGIAKGSLLTMPNVEWSNPELGIFYKSNGEKSISDAFSKATSGFNKGKTDRNNRVQGHFF